MDFYDVLKVPSSAKQIDLDRAYQRIVKEAKYDPTIKIKDVEIAYRTLSDATQRALYDASVAEITKRGEAKARSKKRGKKKENRVRIMSGSAALLFVIAVVYLLFRFGFTLRTFNPGDDVYDRDTNRYFGTILEQKDNHAFGKIKEDAYYVRLPGDEKRWYPVNDLKSRCYKK